MQKVEQIGQFPINITKGGDDRLTLNAQNQNKYFCSPFVQPELLFRGSVTCNFPTQLAYDKGKQVYEEMINGRLELSEHFENIRNQLRQELNLDNDVGIFLSPSGSDAEYIPILLARLLNAEKPLVNIVTCNEEIGSGSLQAASGQYFSIMEPIKGHAEQVELNMGLNQLSDNLKSCSINARDKDGHVIDSSQQIIQLLKRSEYDSVVPIVHQVLGSKTGIQEKFDDCFIEYIQKSKNGFVVVDACQGRLLKEQYMDLINKDVIVLFTGSKFYRGPPFSGAVFVSNSIMQQVQQLNDVKIPQSLNTFIGKSEVPQELEQIRNQLESSSNYGLSLRWSMALEEINEVNKIGEQQKEDAIQKWRTQLIDYIQKQPVLEPLDCEDTKSIVSVKVKLPSDEYMNKAQLQKVFQKMGQQLSKEGMEEYQELLMTRCQTGQPVQITKEMGVLRIALGSDSLRDVIRDFDNTIKQDMTIIDKMVLLAQNYHTLVDQ